MPWRIKPSAYSCAVAPRSGEIRKISAWHPAALPYNPACKRRWFRGDFLRASHHINIGLPGRKVVLVHGYRLSPPLRGTLAPRTFSGDDARRETGFGDVLARKARRGLRLSIGCLDLKEFFEKEILGSGRNKTP